MRQHSYAQVGHKTCWLRRFHLGSMLFDGTDPAHRLVGSNPRQGNVRKKACGERLIPIGQISPPFNGKSLNYLQEKNDPGHVFIANFGVSNSETQTWPILTDVEKCRESPHFSPHSQESVGLTYVNSIIFEWHSCAESFCTPQHAAK